MKPYKGHEQNSQVEARSKIWAMMTVSFLDSAAVYKQLKNQTTQEKPVNSTQDPAM